MLPFYVLQGRRSTGRPAVRRGLRATALTVVMGVLCPGYALGQTVMVQLPPSRPIQTNPNSRSGQGLMVNLSVFEAYDKNQIVDSLQSSPLPAATPAYYRNGARTGGDATLSYGYSHQWARASFGVSARTGANLYSVHLNPLYTSAAGAHVRAPLGRRLSFTATQTFSYAPYYNLGFFPGLAGTIDPADLSATVDPNINQAVYPNHTYQFGLSTGLSYQLSQRSSISVGYDQRSTDFRNGQGSLREYTASARYTRRLSRDLGLHFGYGYSVASMPGTNTVLPVTQNIDIGADYFKALSLSRRTRFSFSSGSTMITNGSSTQPSQFDRRLFDITGSANLDHEIGRTWSARVSYRRGWQFVDSFAIPFFVDAISAGLGGSTSRRGTFGALASYAYASVGVSGQGQHRGYSGNATYRLRFTSWSSSFAQYSYYRFDFPNNVAALPIGFPASLDRHVIRIGLSMNAPLLR